MQIKHKIRLGRGEQQLRAVSRPHLVLGIVKSIAADALNINKIMLPIIKRQIGNKNLTNLRAP